MIFTKRDECHFVVGVACSVIYPIEPRAKSGVDLAYNGTPRDRDGDVLALLRSLPPVTALAVGGPWRVASGGEPVHRGPWCEGFGEPRAFRMLPRGGSSAWRQLAACGQVPGSSCSARCCSGAARGFEGGYSWGFAEGLPWRCCCGL